MNTILTTLAASGAPSYQPFIMIALLFVIMWVLMIRPQQKRQKAMRDRQAALKKGDSVVTIGGMHATVNAVSDHTVSLRLGEGVFVKYDKSAIATVIDKTKSADSKNEAKK